MGNPRKILMLVENLPVPADPRVWTEALSLRDAGFSVSIICPKGATKHQESYSCIDGISIYRYRLPTTTSTCFSYIAEYSTALLKTFGLSFKVLFRHGFDAIHAANPPDIFFVIGLFYRLLGKKFVFDQHDLAPEMFSVIFQGRRPGQTQDGPGRARKHGRRSMDASIFHQDLPLPYYGMKLLHRLLLLLEWCSYRSADLVITTNVSQKRNALERGKCLPERVFVVRNGPDLKRLRPVDPEPQLKGGRRYLLAYLGAMGVQDGIEYALHALRELVYTRGRRDVSLVLMGDGEHLSALRALASELELDAYVHFTGWVNREDIVRYLTVADVGLSPDPQNGLNERSTMIKVMEYMAMGKPVVAFDLAETRFSAQDAALYAHPNVVADFANKIEVLLDNEELRLQMGTIGHKRVEEELSWEHAQEHLLLAYSRLFPVGGRCIVIPCAKEHKA